MNKNQTIRIGILSTLAAALTACSGGKIPDTSLTKQGPRSQETVGVVVSNITEGELARAISSDSRIKVRVVNSQHGVFEIFGVGEDVIQRLILNPQVEIERNQFMRFQSSEILKNQPMDAAQLLSMITEKEAEAFLAPCMNSPTSRPQLKIKTVLNRDKTGAGYLIKIGDSVTLDSTGSTAADGTENIQVMWVLYPNNDSKITPKFALAKKIGFKPDTYGEYMFMAVAKDANSFCTVTKDVVYVTDRNVKFDPSRAMTAEQIAAVDLNRFWQLTATQAQESWKLSTGKDVVVAIIDSGVNYNHPALAANIYVNKGEIPGNGIDDDGNGFIDDVAGYDFGNDDGYPFDDYGHGTHCAGITASTVFGLAKDAKIMPIKVGTGPGIDAASVAGGIFYAVDNGAKILSLSLGFERDAPVMRRAIAYANSKNVVVVAAAGNGDSSGVGINNDMLPMYPASYEYPNVISVAATNLKNNITSYSNYGAKSVDLGAPGGDNLKLILSTYKPNPRGAGLTGMAGTSMAAPAVAGLAAQVLAKKPGMLPSALRSHLMKSGSENVSLAGKTVSGRMINALSALKSE